MSREKPTFCLLPFAFCLVTVFGLSPAHGLSTQPAPARSNRLVLGVVRNDALLLPFAAFDGKKWSAPWPSSVGGGSGRDLPVSVGSVPERWWGGEPPQSWQLWPRNGTTSQPLTLQSPVMMMIGVDRQLGFRTDQKPVLPAVPPFVLPFPKVGVAIAGEAVLEPIASVSSQSGMWKSLATTLRTEIDKAEERSLQALRGRMWNHPYKRDARARVVPELEAWYVTAIPGSPMNMSYIEAAKKYAPLPEDDGCGLETYVSGWIHHLDGQKQQRPALKAVITYCDRRSVSYMLPFGQLKLQGKTYWVVQMSGRDHEWYAVVEGSTDRAKYVAEYRAGRAPLE